MAKKITQVRPRISGVTWERLNKVTAGFDDADSKINHILSRNDKLHKELQYQLKNERELKQAILKQESDNFKLVTKLNKEHEFELQACKYGNRFLASALAISITVSFIAVGFLADVQGWV